MADVPPFTPKVTSDESAKWHETNPIEELLYSQKDIARFQELAYLALQGHPEVAAEIRRTAHESRTQHVLTADLFKKFVLTASSVVNTYCPLMIEAMKLQDKRILVKTFEQVHEMCLDMKRETKDARNRYLAIQKTVQEYLGTVNITNQKIKTEIKNIQQTKKREEAQVEEEKRQEKELKMEEEQLKKKVETITHKRDEWLERSASPSRDKEDDDTFIDAAVILTGAMVAGPLGALVGVGVYIFRKNKKAERALKASQEADKQAQTTYDEKRKVTETLNQRRQQILEKIAHIEALDLQKSSFGDIESLKEAITKLGNVDKQFMKIISFWESMATVLQQFCQCQKAEGLYLKKIEDDRYAEKFTSSINKAEMTWNRIGLICKGYVEVNDEVILKVYGFLSSPVDNMSDQEVQERKASLIQEIRDKAEQPNDVGV